ncbi:MAG: Hpt domain-containing protein, partial [Phycisphaerae bacterium]|nr:Hpt domain-containing protein [Phycisphaerae bacterium]
MNGKDEEFLKKLQMAFRSEAEEHVQAMSSELMDLEKTDDAARIKELVAAIFREAHSLKGAARAVNLNEIEMICQSMK